MKIPGQFLAEINMKGFRGGDAQLKAETVKTLWVEGVNNLGTYGRWDFAEFRDPFTMQAEFDRLVESRREKAVA